MERLSRNRFVLGASGGISLCMKMETYYQKNYVKEQMSKLNQPEVSPPLDYKNELSPEDKANIFKQIYASMELFYRLVRGKRLDAVCAS